MASALLADRAARGGVDPTDLAASGETLDDPYHAIHHKKKGDRHQDAEREAFCQSHLPIHDGTRGELEAPLGERPPLLPP